jgi:hypothetical protein
VWLPLSTCGLAFRIIGDVANQRSDLDLLAVRNLLVVLLLPVKVEQDRVAEGADRGETRRMDTFASSKFLRLAMISSPVSSTTTNVRCPLASWSSLYCMTASDGERTGQTAPSSGVGGSVSRHTCDGYAARTCDILLGGQPIKVI